MSAPLAPSRRVRRSPWTGRVEAAGVSAWTVYNRMRLPAAFRGVLEDCRHLKAAVQVWDVACERQVEVSGPDADRLVRWLTPRDLSRVGEGRCAYAPVCGPDGGMLNDPVALRVDADRWWLSAADGDLGLWVMGLAHAGGHDVRVAEPDVHPLGVQGPLGVELAARVMGGGVRDLPFFGWARFGFGGAEMVVARSGYSKQGGVEIYCPGPQAEALWDALFEAGRDLDVRAGCPNLVERIEGGLLSYGNDVTAEDTPSEAGLGRFCDGAHDHVGRAALAARETRRTIRPVAIEADALPPCDAPWPVAADGRRAGQVTSAAWSEMAGCGVAIGMIDLGAEDAALRVRLPDGRDLPARVRERFWA